MSRISFSRALRPIILIWEKTLAAAPTFFSLRGVRCRVLPWACTPGEGREIGANFGGGVPPQKREHLFSTQSVIFLSSFPALLAAPDVGVESPMVQ